MCSDQEAVDLIRNVHDPIAASKLLVDHALGRFSTDNLSCMIVRFEQDAILHAQNSKEVGVEAENGRASISEVDKIVNDAKQKIADGSTKPVGVSPSNSGRGHDTVPVDDGDFVPTTLDGTVLEEEPDSISDADSPEITPDTEHPVLEMGSSKTESKTEKETSKKQAES